MGPLLGLEDPCWGQGMQGAGCAGTQESYSRWSTPSSSDAGFVPLLPGTDTLQEQPPHLHEASLASSSSLEPLQVLGICPQLANPAEDQLFPHLSPIFKTFVFFISSWLGSSPMSLEFNCATPPLAKQISPDKIWTSEANCNLIQLKL